jgi:hypothetical protein
LPKSFLPSGKHWFTSGLPVFSFIYDPYEGQIGYEGIFFTNKMLDSLGVPDNKKLGKNPDFRMVLMNDIS